MIRNRQSSQLSSMLEERLMASDISDLGGTKYRRASPTPAAVLRIVLSFVAGCLTMYFVLSSNQMSSNKNHSCDISFGTYRGSEYRNPNGSTVGASKCLVESKFLKVQQHHVQMPGSNDIIPDWLWIDYHDRINVLVQAQSQDKASEPSFYVFEQTKYALEGRTSMAIVGGIIEPGEKPEDAARREVAEEMNLQCVDMQFLGRYRTDVNRGMGWTNTFLASRCSSTTSKSTGTAAEANKQTQDGTEEEEVGVADTERQDLSTVSLTELREAVQAGKFLEIQWTATVSLALLHLEQDQ